MESTLLEIKFGEGECVLKCTPVGKKEISMIIGLHLNDALTYLLGDLIETGDARIEEDRLYFGEDGYWLDDSPATDVIKKGLVLLKA